ncbi:TorF family putative porin [Dechloromonas hortensis]|uniref:TorF family putative porin n=1 Tax=Dechloromonas hortensis TaxID=337779 RepID=UPI001292306E|nr:TorF family putative porin [Dechloromonas hortensis]
MKRSLIALALVSAFAAPVFAQSADPSKDEVVPAGPHTLTANVGLFSEYRFRGIAQTASRPAIQGGFDYSHASGFYVGNWNSNVDASAGFPDGNIEMDFYGGYKAAFGDFGVDVGGIYYYYPGSSYVPGGRSQAEAVTNKEIYLGASWKFISAKWYYSVDDYFSMRGWDSTGTANGNGTKGTQYFDLSGNFDLGSGWGINGHVGYLNMAHASNADYTDWKLGVTKDINGWVIGAAYIGTDAKGSKNGSNYQPYLFTKSSGYQYDSGKDTVVVSVSRTF